MSNNSEPESELETSRRIAADMHRAIDRTSKQERPANPTVANVSPVIESMCSMLRARWPDDLARQLDPMLEASQGTLGDGLDDQRAYIFLDLSVRLWCPAMVDVFSPDDAARLRALPDRITRADAQLITAVIERATVAGENAATYVDDELGRDAAAQMTHDRAWLIAAAATKNDPSIYPVWNLARSLLAISTWAAVTCSTHVAYLRTNSLELAEEEKWRVMYPKILSIRADSIAAMTRMVAIR